MSRFLSVDDSDLGKVPFNGASDISRKTGDVSAFAEISAVGVIDALQFFHKEDRSGVMTEHSGDQAGHCNDPAEILKVLGVDEHFVGMAAAVFFHNVVDGDVECVSGKRSFDLVGRTFQFFGTAHGGGPDNDSFHFLDFCRLFFFLLFFLFVLFHENAGEEFGRTEGGASFETFFRSLHIDLLEVFIGIIGRNVDGFGNGTVNKFLEGSLDIEVFICRDNVASLE